MRERIKKINWKFVFVMFVGNVILGLGVAIFKLSGLGNDPFTGMAMGLAECIGIEYPRFVILLNVGFFVIEIIWGRNAAGVANAVIAAEMALAGIRQLIPLDEMIQTMFTVGRKLPAELRETAMGGCAVTPSACEACHMCS